LKTRGKNRILEEEIKRINQIELLKELEKMPEENKSILREASNSWSSLSKMHQSN